MHGTFGSSGSHFVADEDVSVLVVLACGFPGLPSLDPHATAALESPATRTRVDPRSAMPVISSPFGVVSLGGIRVRASPTGSSEVPASVSVVPARGRKKTTRRRSTIARTRHMPRASLSAHAKLEPDDVEAIRSVLGWNDQYSCSRDTAVSGTSPRRTRA